MDDITRLLDELEARLERIDELPQEQLTDVVAVIDGLDALHRSAIAALAGELGAAQVDTLSSRHPAIAWLFQAYDSDPQVAAESALDAVRPFIHSHGGDVEVVSVDGGVVTVRLTGACSGCTASAITLRHGVEEALTDGMSGFRGLEVVEDHEATPHPPPGRTLLDDRPALPLFPGG